MNARARTPNLSMVPLALLALGVCIFLLSGAFGRFIGIGAFIPYGIFTGGVAMIVAGVFALRSEAPFGAAAFTLLGTFFVSNAFYLWFFYPSSKTAEVELAWIALAWTVVLLVLAAGSFSVATIPGPGKLLWVVLFASFLFVWLNGAFHLDWARTVAGVLGIIAAILAWIGGFVTLRAGSEQSGG